VRTFLHVVGNQLQSVLETIQVSDLELSGDVGAAMDPAGSDRPGSGSGSLGCRGGCAGKHTEPVPAVWGTAAAHRRRTWQSTRMSTSTITRTPLEESQFAAQTTRTKNQGKDHPMQDAGPTMRQEDRTQASPAHSAIAHRTLSTPHARATSCGRLTGLPVR
jgi:hypothetical protein